MIKWFKKLKSIVEDYNMDKTYALHCIREVKEIAEKANTRSISAYGIAKAAEKVIRDRTDIHADVHYNKECQVILAGRYKNMDYVQLYFIEPDDFRGLIDHLKEGERYGRVSRIDSPMQFKAVIDHEFRE